MSPPFVMSFLFIARQWKTNPFHDQRYRTDLDAGMSEKGKFGIFADSQLCSALKTMPSYASVVAFLLGLRSWLFRVVSGILLLLTSILFLFFYPRYCLLVSLLMLACLAFMLWLAFLLLLGSSCCWHPFYSWCFSTVVGVPSDVGVPRIHVEVGVSAVAEVLQLLKSLLFQLFPLTSLLFLEFPPFVGVPAVFCSHADIGVSTVAGVLLLTFLLLMVFFHRYWRPFWCCMPRIHVVAGVSAVVGSCCCWHPFCSGCFHRCCCPFCCWLPYCGWRPFYFSILAVVGFLLLLTWHDIPSVHGVSRSVDDLAVFAVMLLLAFLLLLEYCCWHSFCNDANVNPRSYFYSY